MEEEEKRREEKEAQETMDKIMELDQVEEDEVKEDQKTTSREPIYVLNTKDPAIHI